MSQPSSNTPIVQTDNRGDIAPAGPGPGASDEADPLAHLYKMSRTAGLGSGDYVAVNPVAVTSIVFGLASALVIVDSLFIVLPVVGLILGVLAWRQVRKSNGTQTGGLMAVAAILLSVGFLGAKVGKESLQSLQQSADKKAISQVIDSFGQQISAIDSANMPSSLSHLSTAYDLFDEKFKSRVNRETFDARWIAMQASPYYGSMISFRSNGLLKFATDPRTGDLFCSGIGIADFKAGGAARWSLIFRQLNAKWYIEDLPDMFPAAPPPPPDKR
jgi:hypothetical protein